MALPVLVLVLVGLGYVHALCRAKQTAAMSARTSAWQQALAGCHGEAVTVEVPAEIERASTVPLLGTVLDTVYPEGAVFSAPVISVSRPRLLQTSPKSNQPPVLADEVSASLFLLCNEVSTTPWDATKKVFLDVLGDALGG